MYLFEEIFVRCEVSLSCGDVIILNDSEFGNYGKAKIISDEGNLKYKVRRIE